jgi:O-antigen/teichoic acid export membrane protein
MSLAQRAVAAVSWNLGTNLLKVFILLTRSILLARLLPVETFGVYALATAIVTLSGILPQWGLGSAFLHRAPQTSDESHAAAVHFTLRLALTAVWLTALLGLALWLAEGALRLALVALALVFAGLYLVDTPKAILVRRVQHRRLALLDLLTAAATTVVAVALAARGYGLWALLATDVVTLALAVVAFYLWRPVWRPRLLWAADTVRYYLRFGSRTMAESALSEALDNLDDLWTGAALGPAALGLYSRAYTFATYPRRLLAMPVNAVAGGAYAELKTQRLALSRAFFRTNALLVRSGFLLGGLLVLVAPEFTRLALGERWLPMVPAFRLMAVFTLLDPIRVTVSSLFVAVGRPEQVVRTRLAQLAAMVVGLFVLGARWGITGVALVVDGVLLIGLGWLLARARAHVDFSVARLFGAPLLALLAGAAAGLGAAWLLCRAGPGVCGNDWLSGGAKALAFTLGFAGVLLAFERGELRELAGQLTPRR